MSLDADERQEHRNAAKRCAEYAELQWQAFMETSIPTPLCEDLMVEWWRIMLTPRIEMPQLPDLSKLFRQEDDDD